MMSNPVSKFLWAAIIIYLLTISAVWADRILVDDPQQTVAVSNNLSCYRPVDITIDTVNPGLYDNHSAQLQKLGDSVKAMLTYECPGLDSIRITGLIRGLDEIVYQGEMLKNNGWLVQPLIATAQEYGAIQNPVTKTPEDGISKRYDDELKQGLLEVTGLQLGMTVEQVTDLVYSTFGIAPQYDAQKGLLTMNSGNCPEHPGSASSEYETGAELKCLQAWFSDNRVARLQRLNLYQVVSGQVRQVNTLMTKKYGSPIETINSADNSQTQMVWRAINTDREDQSVIQEIDALIKNVDNNLVSTNVSLYSTQTANDDSESYADLDLKL